MSFGEELRRERELREISLREVSEATKINIRYLEALETNDFSHLPGGVFNRGFVRAYAQFIGIDPDGMVDAYVHEEQNQDGVGPSAEPRKSSAPAGRRALADANAGTDTGTPSGATGWWPWAVAAVLLALLAAAGWYYFARPTPTDASASPLSDAPAGGSSAAPAARTAPSAPEATHVTGLRSTASTAGAVVTTLWIDAPTAGRFNCDDRQVETLDGAQPGTRFDVACSRFLVIDVTDGAAMRLGVGGEPPSPLGAPGQPVRGHRIDIPAWLARRAKDQAG